MASTVFKSARNNACTTDGEVEMVSSKKLVAVVAAVTLTALTAACSSSGAKSPAKGSSSGTGTATANRTIVLGMETDSTGPLASSFGAGTIAAAKARLDQANATHEVPGVTFKLVTADENTSPTGALQAAQSLVEDKHAVAILDTGAFFFGAYRYLVQKNIPVFGIGIDGPEWADKANTNLFSYEGSTDPDFPSYTGLPAYFKSKGVTRFCGITYAGTSASINPGKAMMDSVKRDGINIAYENLTVPLGGTDFGATALAIKNAHCDGLGTWMVISSDIALFQALKNVGISGSSFKGSYITGVYGQDLLDDPAALAAAQGYGVGSVYQVASLNTAATKNMMSALKTYANYDKPYPLSSHQWGWFTADLAVFAYKNAGGTASQADVISTLRKVTNYTAGGLQCPVDFTQAKNAITQFSGNCAWIATVQGNGFVSTPDPIKMTIISGTKNA
jgi:branched-chain amino acid transport system substrate-binding protein